MHEQENGQPSAADAAFDARFGDVAIGEGGPDAAEGDDLPEHGGDEAGAGSDGGDSGAAGDAAGGLESGQGGEADPALDRDDAAGAGDGTPDQDKLAQQRRHTRTQEGRLAKTEEALQRALDELEALKAGKGAREDAGPDNPNAPRPVEIPKDLEPDAAEFDEMFPDLSPLLRRPGPDGDRLRRMLKESGADFAGMVARNLQLTERVERLARDGADKEEHKARRVHEAFLSERHPEVAGLFVDDPVARIKSRRFVDDVRLWLYGLEDPNERDRKLDLLANGSAKEVDAMLAAYKQTTSSKPQNAGLDADTRRRAAEAGGVDNRRAARPRREPTDQERADDAFDKRFGA